MSFADHLAPVQQLLRPYQHNPTDRNPICTYQPLLYDIRREIHNRGIIIVHDELIRGRRTCSISSKPEEIRPGDQAPDTTDCFILLENIPVNQSTTENIDEATFRIIRDRADLTQYLNIGPGIDIIAEP